MVEDTALAETGLGRGGVEGQSGHPVTQDHLLGRVDDAPLGLAAPGGAAPVRWRGTRFHAPDYTVWTVQ